MQLYALIKLWITLGNAKFDLRNFDVMFNNIIELLDFSQTKDLCPFTFGTIEIEIDILDFRRTAQKKDLV